MPNIDESAKRWELELAGRFGRAVASRRKKLSLTAVDLAARTKELGYPISRVTISKIENNARAGKVDVAELLVLAAALEIPPGLLVVPDFPDGEVEVLPNLRLSCDDGMRWIAGRDVLSELQSVHGDSFGRVNPGVELVEAINEAREIQTAQVRFRAMTASRDFEQVGFAGQMLERNQERLDRLAAVVERGLNDLWAGKEVAADG